MYILYAPFARFGAVPRGTALFTPSIKFTDNIASTSLRYWRDFAVKKGIRDITPKSISQYNNKKRYNDVLFIAMGGIGDILWSVPVIKRFKLLHPHCRVTVHCSKDYFSVLLNNPFIYQYTFLPPHYIPLMFYLFDEIIDFGGAVVNHPEQNTKHAVDLYFEKAHLSLPLKAENRAPKIFVDDTEKALIFSFLKTQNIDPLKDDIAIVNTESSAPIRTYPFERSVKIATELAEKGFKVFLLGRSKEILHISLQQCECGFTFPWKHVQNIKEIYVTCTECGRKIPIKPNKLHPNIIPLIGTVDFRLATCLISQADIFIGPDSGLLQVAAALSVPSVGLYGPIPASLRVKYYEKHVSLEGECPKKRCFRHKPICPIGDPSPCLLDIQPEQVLKLSLEVHQKFREEKEKKWYGIPKLLEDKRLQKLGSDFSRIFTEKALTSVVDSTKLIRKRLESTKPPSPA